MSEFVFAAGVKLLGEFKPDLMYLTTTDFVQHTQALGINQSSVSLRIGALEQKLGTAPFDRKRRGGGLQ